MTHRSTGRGRALRGRGLGRRVAALLLLTGATACGTHPQDLGQVPIPSAPASPIVPTASVGHAQLVAMGDAVHLDLGARQGQITVAGPDLAVTAASPGAGVPTASKGTVTVTLRSLAGSQTLGADSLVATDELGHAIALTADAASVTAEPGHDGVLHLSGTFAAGHATLTWNSAGKPLATWDFEIELD